MSLKMMKIIQKNVKFSSDIVNSDMEIDMELTEEIFRRRSIKGLYK